MKMTHDEVQAIDRALRLQDAIEAKLLYIWRSSLPLRIKEVRIRAVLEEWARVVEAIPHDAAAGGKRTAASRRKAKPRPRRRVLLH